MGKHPPDEHIVERLDTIMRAWGSDGAWGKALGVHRKTVWAYRHGVSDIPATQLMRVCIIAKTDPNYILLGRT